MPDLRCRLPSLTVTTCVALRRVSVCDGLLPGGRGELADPLESTALSTAVEESDVKAAARDSCPRSLIGSAGLTAVSFPNRQCRRLRPHRTRRPLLRLSGIRMTASTGGVPRMPYAGAVLRWTRRLRRRSSHQRSGIPTICRELF